MLLEGFREVDFALELVDRTAAGVRLRPSYLNRLYSDEWESTGEPRTWSADEVAAAADWFGRVAAGLEEPGGPHVWFGGGVCFGVVEDVDDGLAIDVLVMHDPNGQRPTFTGRFLDDESAPYEFNYMTVDARMSVLADAAAWWRQLAG